MRLFFIGKRDCHRARGLLSPNLDQALKDRDSHWLEGHLAGCDRCRLEMEGLRMAQQMLRKVPQAAVPHSFTLTPEMAQHSPSRPPAFRPLAYASSVAVLALALVLSLDLTGNLPAEEAAPTPQLALGERQAAGLEATPEVAMMGPSTEGAKALVEPAVPKEAERAFQWWAVEIGLGAGAGALLLATVWTARKRRLPVR